MTRVVFDCGILVSAIGWNGNPRSCLALVHAGEAQLFVTDDIWREYESRIPAILKERRHEANPTGELLLLLERVHFVEPAPLGRLKSRDAKDNAYLACALAAQADALVTNDRDLLDLGRPAGIRIMTPIEFLKLIRNQAGL